MTDLITAEEATKLLEGTLLTELANEHRALLLQAIGTDDADAMVYSKDGKPTRRVSEMTSPAKQAADVISGMARTVIALHAQLAEAQAAQAVVVERAAAKADRGHGTYCRARGRDPEKYVSAFYLMAREIRALAPIDGLALVRELRAERDEAYVRGMAAGQQALAQIKGPLQVVDSPELHTLRAERDRLAAANAALEAKVAGLVDAARTFRRMPNSNDAGIALDAALATQEGNPV